MWWTCDCANPNCTMQVYLDTNIAAAIQAACQTVIVEGCPTGPQTDDVLVEEREGYSIYWSANQIRPAKEIEEE